MIIAGAVGSRPLSYLQSLTKDLLDEQRIYGAGSQAIISVANAALGVGHTPRGEPNLARIGDWLVVADARLDNRDELKERVGETAGRTDAELLLNLWMREGERSLGWIAGDFALAIFDPRDRSLSLARDVTGQRPLFYAQTDFGLAFASMPAALSPAFSNVSVDRRSLALLALDSPVDCGRSFFDGVGSVGQAQVVRFSSNGHLSRNSYWKAPPTPPDRGDRRTLIEE